MTAGRDLIIQEAKNSIEAEKGEQERALAQKILFEAKRENVKLQLEAAYREQLLNVYNEVNWLNWLK